MRQLFPSPIDRIDPLEVYPDDHRPSPGGRPWVMVNMIASVDGATAVDGLSGGLGGPADKAVFRAVRASCDWILVASATAGAERYRAPRRDPEVVDRRERAGRAATPGLAIVTASGRVDPTIPAFTGRDDGDDRPVVLTGTEADDAALAALDAEVVRLETPRPTPSAVLSALRKRGAGVVLCEGGPSWNGILVGSGLVDELCLSVSPLLAGGDAARIVQGAAPAPVDMRLDRLLEEGGFLFARYVRA